MISRNTFSLRTRMGLTQEELARRAGVSRQTVVKWESGDAIPDLDNARRLSAIFDVSIDDLVFQKEEG